MEVWVAFNVLEHDLPAPSTRFLGLLRDGVGLFTDSVRACTEAAVHWANGGG
jgi:hypothetical protein